jgi:hypothetical protein
LTLIALHASDAFTQRAEGDGEVDDARQFDGVQVTSVAFG